MAKKQSKKAAKIVPELLPVPDFTPYFDRLTPLPGERSKQHKGYLVGVPDEKYFAWQGVNASLLGEKTACEMLHYMRTKREDDFGTEARAQAFTVGTLVHWCVLEPWRFDPENKDRFMVLCETEGLATKRAMAQRKEQPQHLLVTGDHLRQAHECLVAIRCHERAMHLLTNPHLNFAQEVMGAWFDPELSIWRKWKIDLMPINGNYMLDVKSTRRNLYEFERDGWEYDYWLKAAWYLDSHYMLTGEWKEIFYWINVTKSAPFMARVEHQVNLRPSDPDYEGSKLAQARARIGLDPESMRLGRLTTFIQCASETEQLRRAQVELDSMLLRKTWPGYENETPDHLIY